MPSFPDITEPLSDGRVRLRLAAERDIPEILIAYQDDPDLFASLGLSRPPSGAELGRQIEEAPAARAAGSHLALTILEPASEDCRGQVHVQDVDWDHARAELGIWVVPQARGRHLARAALQLAAHWLFQSCGIERVQLLTGPGNEPLICAAQAAGFVPEGTLRAHERERGRRVDRTILSLLPADLAELRR